MAHRGRGARVAAATAREARREGEGLSTAFAGVEWGAKKREEEWDELHAATGIARALAEPGCSGHMPQEVRERERRGGLHGGMMRTSRHLDWREGEARGGRGTRCQRSGALPRAPEHANGRHPRLFARTRAPPCVWRLQGE